MNNDENLKGKPNENLARELMELFTMGRGMDTAKKTSPKSREPLTGMTMPVAVGGSGAVMRPFLHDTGMKTIFGHTGNYGPEDVVTLIFDRPGAGSLPRSETVDFLSDADAIGRRSGWSRSRCGKAIGIWRCFWVRAVQQPKLL